MFIIIAVIITCAKKVMIIIDYKIKDLYTANRSMSCITLKLSIFKEFITNICSSLSAI